MLAVQCAHVENTAPLTSCSDRAPSHRPSLHRRNLPEQLTALPLRVRLGEAPSSAPWWRRGGLDRMPGVLSMCAPVRVLARALAGDPNHAATTGTHLPRPARTFARP